MLSILIMVVWDKSPLKKKLPYIPSALVAVILGIVLNQIWIGASSSLQIVEAVSYTHLDVYKRQHIKHLVKISV